MILLERYLGAFAVAQAIVASLRAASRAWYIQNGGQIGIMEGPLILPPENNETSQLFDLSTAFRDGVRLAIERDRFDFEYDLNELYLPELNVAVASRAGSANTPRSSGPHDEFKALLDEEPKSEANRTKPVLHHALTDAVDSLSMPLKQAPVTVSSLSHSVLDMALKGQRHDNKDNDEEYSEHLGSMTSDFYLTLTTKSTVGLANATSRTARRAARIRAYAPDCFAELRASYGISEEVFRTSILESGPFVSFESNSKGAARVGGVFFFTRDGAYMIKTIKQDEVKTLLSMLPRYFHFMKRNGRRSLLTRFCGMYEVKFGDEGDGDVHTFIIMNSVFPAEAPRLLSERFDLKGSTIGRECTIEEREAKGRNAVLKDLDLAREVKLMRSLSKKARSPGYGIDIGATSKAALMEQLRRDVAFLVACQVIDYSLLIGVAKESLGLSEADLRAMDRGKEGQMRLTLLKKGTSGAMVLSGLLKPVRLILTPPLFLSRKSWKVAQRLLDIPNPFYGTGLCGVDGGPFTHVPGRRMGSNAMYYFGLIDFLQPFNTKKNIEYRLKSLVYDDKTFSCVPPEEYAERFLKFLDEHIV